MSLAAAYSSACPIIKVSHGPADTPTDFYATSYAIDYKKKYIVGQARKPDSSGYTRNVIPYVSYNKKIDEDSINFR